MGKIKKNIFKQGLTIFSLKSTLFLFYCFIVYFFMLLVHKVNPLRGHLSLATFVLLNKEYLRQVSNLGPTVN